MTYSQQISTRARRQPVDTRVPLVMWSTSAGSLLGIDAAVFMRIDGVNRVKDLAEMIGETVQAVTESLARLEALGLLTFLSMGTNAGVDQEKAAEELEASLELVEAEPHEEDARDTLPEAPSTLLVEACALEARPAPRRPPPLPARARRPH